MKRMIEHWKTALFLQVFHISTLDEIMTDFYGLWVRLISNYISSVPVYLSIRPNWFDPERPNIKDAYVYSPTSSGK